MLMPSMHFFGVLIKPILNKRMLLFATHDIHNHAVNSTDICVDGEFRCNNGRCIKDSLASNVSKTNRDDNCGDGSDINLGSYKQYSH